MGLRGLLVVHGIVTLAAAVILTVAPGLIPRIVRIHLEPSAYLMAYLLAAAEFGLSSLSFGGSQLTDLQALRLISWTCVVFHVSSGLFEVRAYMEGVSTAVLGNVVARGLIIALFLYFLRSRAALAAKQA